MDAERFDELLEYAQRIALALERIASRLDDTELMDPDEKGVPVEPGEVWAPTCTEYKS